MRILQFQNLYIPEISKYLNVNTSISNAAFNIPETATKVHSSPPTKLQLIRYNAEICVRERFNQKHEICFFALALSEYIRVHKGSRVTDKGKKFIFWLQAGTNNEIYIKRNQFPAVFVRERSDTAYLKKRERKEEGRKYLVL